MGRGVVVVVVGVDVVVGLVVVLVVEVVVGLLVVVVGEDVVVEVLVVVKFPIVVGLLVVVVVEVVVLLQALNTKDVTSSKDVMATSHFLLNLLANLLFSFISFTFIIKGYL